MWTRNTDTGKWINQVDTLSKDSYDSLKQDLESVKLFSKCLSGSTYLPINNLDDIYDVLNQDKIGFYVNSVNSIFNYPLSGPLLSLNSSTSNEFYNKYLKENAFTLKNLFTPTKLIDDQLKNYLYVDVITTESLSTIGQTVPNLTIDGILLKEGHRVLVKDQITNITLPSTTDPEVYFSTIEQAANYYEVEDLVTAIAYYYYNSENGIYTYTNNKLVKTDELDTYDSVYRYSVVSNLGTQNREKQYHLLRLKDGYYPVGSENQNFEFREKHNWILRNRVDYNNIYDINYYDIIHHDAQEIYDSVVGRTYSIPPRTVAVGEFGVIIDNQDTISSSATFSQSHIISNKYKVNINSISEVNDYYWMCGDEGTLLKVSKIDFTIQRFELNETSNLTSISFFNNLNGMVVGKFNTIYWTNDGGYRWTKLTYPEFDLYSYNKVVQYDFNQAYVGGEAGIFIEFNYSGGTWLAYKRKVAKQLSALDEYILVEDINDMYKTSWVNLESTTYSIDQSLMDFDNTLVYTNQIINNLNELEISIDTKYFGNPTFSNSEFYIALQISNSSGVLTSSSNISFTFSTPLPSYNTFDLYQVGTSFNKYTFTYSLPVDIDGNLVDDTYLVEANVIYNYDAQFDINGGFLQKTTIDGDYPLLTTYTLKTQNSKLLLISTNNENIICYDIDSNITLNKNQFIYYGFSQSHSDVKTIVRAKGTQDIYIGGDKIYKFPITDFYNIGNSVTNLASSIDTTVVDLYANKLFTTSDNLYVAGNNSLLRTNDYSSSDFNDLDPTFNDGIKSKMLFLDYDIASKLNFFDDSRQYRLADPVTFTWSSLPSSISIGNITGEHNWLNYYKDSEKTFEYYTSMDDFNVVQFSSTFSSTASNANFTFSNSQVSIDASDIIQIAPTINSSTASKFISGSTAISATFMTSYDVFINKYLIIFKRDNTDPTEVGDVLRFKSDVVECNLVVNKILYYVGPSGSPKTLTSGPVNPPFGSNVDKYIYCYGDFNQNITNNLKKLSLTVSVTNLNKYSSINELIDSFEYHPVGIGYKLSNTNGELTVDQRFNNKTAYYNMQSEVIVDSTSQNMTYKESFLNFGYSPTYNLLDYLGKIDSGVFTPTKKFSILPEYTSLPGNNGGSLTANNIYISTNTGVQSNGTYSWYVSGTNQIIFGSNYKFYWESLLLYTFVDIKFTSTTNTITLSRLLINKKYYDSDLDSYVMEFHKKLELTSGFNAYQIDILSRNTLEQISDDLQMLNNIQRTTTVKSVQYLSTFTNFENELKYKFPTDSYLKALVSDNEIRKYLSSIIYTDSNNQLAMNIINLDKEITYDIINTGASSVGGFVNKLSIQINQHDLKIGDLVLVNFTGGAGSSQELNPTYFGLQTVIYVPNNTSIVTSIDYNTHTPSLVQDYGTVTFIKKDPFLNYQPIDIFNLGFDHKVTRSVEILPENFDLVGSKYSLINLDLTKYKFQFVDGLSLDEVNQSFPWLLEAEISNAVIGRDSNGPIWYSGTWKCGRWFGGTWMSGKWVSGDWYGGTWNSYNTKYKVISVQVDTSYVDDTTSKWFNGRWFDGTWNGGTWYNGRRYAGDWKRGKWYNGIWNDGHWYNGNFEGGIWVQGTWDKGLFNCNSKPAYWIWGTFTSGDFENGIWYGGQFGNDKGALSRFGTKSSNSRTSTWHGGKWITGEFHSYLNTNSQTGKPDVSDIHKYSIWNTGTWYNGDFYGGIAFNIDFKKGTWHGGILEEIQIVNVDDSTNTIVINGIFKFNIGDQIWIIDDDTNNDLSLLGSNTNPMSYRINKIVEEPNTELTTLYLNYDLGSLGITSSLPLSVSTETGLRVVSYFKDSNWQSGIWTNGIFEGGQFDSGIWYNGVFNGTWGN